MTKITMAIEIFSSFHHYHRAIDNENRFYFILS